MCYHWVENFESNIASTTRRHLPDQIWFLLEHRDCGFFYYQELFTNWIIEEFLVKNIHSQFCVSNFLRLTLLNSYTFISLSLITMRKEWTNHCNEEIKKTLMFKRHMAPKWRWVCAVRGGCCTVTRGWFLQVYKLYYARGILNVYFVRFTKNIFNWM